MAILAKNTAFLPHIAVKRADFCGKKQPFWAKSGQYLGHNLASKRPIFQKRQKRHFWQKKELGRHVLRPNLYYNSANAPPPRRP